MQKERIRVPAQFGNTLTANNASAPSPGRALAFSFGDPESVLATSPGDYLGVFAGPGDYYEPPVSRKGLAKILRANGYHGTIPPFRRNLLLKHYKSNSVLSDADLGRACIDFDVFGDCYFQKIFNAFGEVIRYKHLRAINMRRSRKPDVFVQLQPGNAKPIEFNPGEVVNLQEYDVMQGLYGVPQYFGGIQAVLLGESATLFRRKYYINGAHMGYILYTSDPTLDEEDEEAIKTAVKNSKGVGNFRSLYLNIPNGKKDSVQIIPVGDISTKDEYERIKNITRSEILAMWRIQPALAGVMPENTGGHGDIEKIARVYFEYETVPMQDNFLQLNQFLKGSNKLAFGKPKDGEY